MDVFSMLEMVGGLSLFLFGMSVMGEALEKRAGGKLRSLLAKMTGTKIAGFLTGFGVTAIIQSSSATTVMVVGFVNSGLLTLRQAINVVIGSNVGTTATAWLLSLSGVSSDTLWVKLFKPSSFTPVLALIGIVWRLFSKDAKKKDTGLILLGFATLMIGMENMSGAASSLRDLPEFQRLFLLFSNPILGTLAGALLTAVIQSSSASVGILQALSSTGQVAYGIAIPIIVGQNIGTCITALLSSVGANANAKRAAVVHLLFNVIGAVAALVAFCLIRGAVNPTFLSQPASMIGIAVAHTAFNVLSTVLLLPFSDVLEKLALKVVSGKTAAPNEETLLDDRLLTTPPLALGRCHDLACDMAQKVWNTLSLSICQLRKINVDEARRIRETEEETDRYEDEIGSYLIKLSSKPLNQTDSEVATALLKNIGDFERIADHAVDILNSAEEMRRKKLHFSQEAWQEMSILQQAVDEIMRLSIEAFRDDDIEKALCVEPLEQVIDNLKEQMRTRHIIRMKREACNIEVGFVWSDLLTSLERVADHCSNIAGCVIEMKEHRLTLHDTLRKEKTEDAEFKTKHRAYAERYTLAALLVR